MSRRYRVTCSVCTFEMRIAAPIDFYFYEDPIMPRPLMFVWQQIAWCSSCKTVVNAEYLPDADELQEGYKRLYLKWRLSRRSPARCLDCGSIEIFPFEMGETPDDQTLPHPGCSGILSLQWRGHLNSAASQCYTAEGIKITSEESSEDQP